MPLNAIGPVLKLGAGLSLTSDQRVCHFRCGSFASVWPLAGDFRSTANNGHRWTGPPRPFGANRGHRTGSVEE